MKPLKNTRVDQLFLEISSALEDIGADIEPENLSAFRSHIENCLVANGADLHAPSSYEEAGKAVAYFTACALADPDLAVEAKQDVLAIQRAFRTTQFAA